MACRQVNWLSALGFCLALLLAVPAAAQTFEDGYQSYMRNQFPVAELQFRAAAKKAKTKDERAFILKFIGICQYMRGDKRTSAFTFQEGLKLDRKISIDDGEVLDPGVVTFFNGIKARWMTSPEGLAAAKAAGTAKAPAAPASPSAKPAEEPATPRPMAQEDKAQAALPPAVEKPKRRKIRDNTSKSEEGSRMISWLHFMPFGVGQFHNESYILGSAFAAGQIYSLYQVVSLSLEIEQKKKLSTRIENNPNILVEDKADFLPRNEDFIAGLVKDRNTAGAAFLALYIAGVTEAIIFAPRSHAAESNGPESSKKLSKNTLDTAWLPSATGGTFWIQLSLNLN